MDEGYKQKYMQLLEESVLLHKKVSTLEKLVYEKDKQILELKSDARGMRVTVTDRSIFPAAPTSNAASSSESLPSKPMQELKAEIGMLAPIRKYPTLAPAPPNSYKPLLSKERLAAAKSRTLSLDKSAASSQSSLNLKRSLSSNSSLESRKRHVQLCNWCSKPTTKLYHTFSGRGKKICKYQPKETAIAIAALVELNSKQQDH